MWTIAAIVLLIAGIAGMIWYHSSHAEEPDPTVPERDPLINAVATPSMKATRKYFFIVIALMLLQIGMGAITAHYAVEGQAFFGFPLGRPAALHDEPHDPHADGDLLDRHRVARDGPVHRAAPLGARAQAAEARRGRALLRAGRGRGGLHRLRLAGHAAARRASTSTSGWATRGWNSRAWAASGRSCSSAGCSSGSSSSAGRCGRR